jgi:hypothetical protein
MLHTKHQDLSSRTPLILEFRWSNCNGNKAEINKREGATATVRLKDVRRVRRDFNLEVAKPLRAGRPSKSCWTRLETFKVYGTNSAHRYLQLTVTSWLVSRHDG